MSPESTEVPKSAAELQYEKRFATEASAIINDQRQADTDGDDSIDRAGIFIDRVLQAADAGGVKLGGNVIDSKQLLLQFGDFLIDSAKAKDATNTEAVQPFKNIPRDGHLRAAFEELSASPMADRFTKVLHERTGIPLVEKEAEQPTVADIQERGNVALDAVGTVEPIPDEDPLEKARNAATGIIEGIPQRIANPADAIPLPPPLTLAEVATPVEAPKTPETSEETQAEMFDRFVSEYRQERSDLYAELRTEESKPQHMRDLDAIDRLQRDIKYTTEQMGDYAGKAARAKGQNWSSGGAR